MTTWGDLVDADPVLRPRFSGVITDGSLHTLVFVELSSRLYVPVDEFVRDPSRAAAAVLERCAARRKREHAGILSREVLAILTERSPRGTMSAKGIVEELHGRCQQLRFYRRGADAELLAKKTEQQAMLFLDERPAVGVTRGACAAKMASLDCAAAEAVVAALSDLLQSSGQMVRLCQCRVTPLGPTGTSMSKRTALQVLGLSASPGIKVLKRTYMQMCLKHHPDKGGNKDDFLTITLAFNCLTGKRAFRATVV